MILVRKLLLKPKIAETEGEVKKLAGMRCSLLFSMLRCFRWGSASGPSTFSMLLASNIKLCRLTREESILGEQKRSDCFSVQGFFNFFSPSKSDP